MDIIEWLSGHGLDAFTTALGLLYILLEYRASIWLWLVGVVMPALDIILYWSHGLYGDAGMAAYYTGAAIYGYAVWKKKEKGVKMSVSHENGHKNGEEHERGITHFPTRLVLPTLVFFLAAWGLTWWVLVKFTNSTVPVIDAFTNALSFVGLWALARKYAEQWLMWIVVDAVCCYLYVVKGIPFKAALYGLYVVIAVMGYRKWVRMIHPDRHVNNHKT